ncbi:MAG TPA: tyrosine-type recombinase/integrase, partial [Mycobacterium sp.]|nr:tyrosine-type recombinase/integrase [Mycobacterium sp.]
MPINLKITQPHRAVKYDNCVVDSLLDLESLLDSWLIALRGERKSPSTLKAYQAGVDQFLAFCDQEQLPRVLSKSGVRAFMASLADTEPATARLRLQALKLFARWLAEEEGFDPDPVLSVRAPKLDDKAVPDLSPAEVKAMLKACIGKGFRDKRDNALLLLLTETGLRGGECLALNVEDVNLKTCSLLVRRGKGAKGRNVRFSPSTAAALDRYMRARLAAGNAAGGALWVSSARPQRLSYRGMSDALGARAEQAGVANFHPHRLRHTAAVRWLASGGSETGLMAQSGWASRKMID